MAITSPPFAIEGELLVQLVGVGMSLVADVEIVASNGAEEFRIVQNIELGRTDTLIQVNVSCGLIDKINGVLGELDGVPLTDSQWSLKWVVGADELGVVISPPASIQQREIENVEKLGGWLVGINFGAQDQQFGEIDTATNTVKHTESNGKATGFLDGTERTMTETITNFFFTAQDGKWRKRDISITTFNIGNEFKEEFTSEFT